MVGLAWPAWQVAWGALICWGLAWLAAGEPQPTRAARHKDVRDTERTELGRALQRREGWILGRPATCLGAIALVSLLCSAALCAALPAWRAPRAALQVVLWTPPVLLAAGYVIGVTINLWSLWLGLGAIWLLGVIGSFAEGEPQRALALTAAPLAALAAVFCADQVRGLRRALGAPSSPGSPGSGS